MAAEDGSSKYSVLPFLDPSGRDVFESGADTTEATDQQKMEDDVTNEEIEITSLDQKSSFNVFKDKYVDASGLDFSDRIHRTHKVGYEAKTVYEIIGEQVAVESPQQKYQRLQHEMSELADELAQIQESSEASAKESSAVGLANHVRALEGKLHELHLEKVLGSETTGSKGIQQGKWAKDIANQLRSFEARPSGKDEEVQGSVLYQVYCKPEHTKFAQTGKISELESKVKAMEDLVGKDSQRLNTIIADPNMGGTSLMDAAANLQAKVSLMDLQHIDVVSARLQGLLHCINEVSQKKEVVEDTEKQSKISELDTIVHKWDSVATTVPELVERLRALKGLHEQASNFSQSLEHLTSSQAEVKGQLHSQNETLEKFEKSLCDNVAAIQSNCVNLDTRIQAVMKKLGEA